MGAGQRIVVGVDGSAASVKALRWAAQQATMTDATLDVVLAWEPPTIADSAPLFGAPSMARVPVSTEEVLDSAQRRLDEVIDATNARASGAKIAAKVVEGHPAPVLIQAAQDADLLVVGSSGHGAFIGMLLGSVTGHVTAHAPCPVVVVRGTKEN